MSARRSSQGDSDGNGGTQKRKGQKPQAVREHLGGDSFLGGAIVRIFLDADQDRGAAAVARIVSAAGVEAATRGITVGIVVLPAGADTIPPIQIDGRWWTEEARATTQSRAGGWAEELARRLGPGHPPIVAGIDQRIEFLKRRGKRVFWEQLMVRVEVGTAPHVTWKSTPVGADEEKSLYVPWSREHGDPAAGAVASNGAVGRVGGQPALFLVCHDGTAFARTRWLPRAHLDSWRVVVRRQYEEEIKRHRPAIAVNLIHKLPGHAESRLIPSPFLNGHRNLREGRLPLPVGEAQIPKVPVVAVSGLNAKCPEDPFGWVAKRLSCPFAHIDIRFREPCPPEAEPAGSRAH